MSPDEVIASSCRMTAARLRAGDPVALAMAADGVHAAGKLLAMLDPRTPPADIGRALLIVASHAAATLVDVHDGDVNAVDRDGAVALNLIGMVGYQVLSICGELAAVIAAGSGAGEPS